MNSNNSLVEMRPPVDRTMRVLERAFFKKTISLSAARIIENKQIASLKRQLAHETFQLDRVTSVKPSPLSTDQSQNRKALLLRPDIRADKPETWTSTLNELSKQGLVSVIPFEISLDYEYWTYDDIMQAILPESDHNEIPTGFSLVGHVAHLNLRSQYLPYKHLIAEVLVDKNPNVRTVINKIDDVGAASEFRTFNYEVLLGDPSLEVETAALDCRFRFDYSKVYWNPRLNTEHERLVNMFQPGEAVCDVMSGIGPFAVPAAKRKIFVWANDLNPASYEAMVDAISLNKVGDYLKPFNMDGRQFIRQSAQQLLQTENQVEVKAKRSRSAPAANLPPPTYHVQPKTFQHYAMNLPATATHFLDAFIGLYSGQEEVFAAKTGRNLPMIHVYCFSTKSNDNSAEKVKICAELSSRLQHQIEVDDDELMIHDVRDVAPNKRMFCASFRLPKEVAFRKI